MPSFGRFDGGALDRNSANDGRGEVAVGPTNAYRLRTVIQRQTGVLVDSGGRGFNGFASPGNDVMWGNRGYVSSKAAAAGTDGSVRFAPAAFDWEFGGTSPQSLIMSFRVRAAAPAANIRIMGNSANDTVRGFGLTATTTGRLIARVCNGTTTNSTPESGRVALDNSDHWVCITCDAATRMMSIFVDDEEIPQAASLAFTGSSLNTTSPFRLGSAGLFNDFATAAVQFADLQILTVRGGLPANIGEIRHALRRNPALMIGVDLIPDQPIAATEGVAPITTGATPATQSLLRYLKKHHGRPEFLLGAHDRFDDPEFAPREMGYLGIYERISGRRPAIMKWEYVDIQQPDDGAGSTGAERQPNLIAAMRAFSASGGINMLHDHPGHPLTSTMARSIVPNSATGGPAAGSSWDTTPGALAAINTGGAQNAQFLAWLDRLATFFEQLDSPVIFRPFHEVNGSWFWWGGVSTASTFISVWRLMVTYLRDTRGIKNVLFCWNVNGADDSASQVANSVNAYSTWYPGDEWVDIVSIDYYNDRAWSESTIWTLGRSVLRQGVDALNVIAAPTGKPMLLAEIGYRFASEQKADLWELVGTDVATIYQDCAALCLWRAPWGPIESHASAPSLRKMMSEDYCITLDRVGGKAYTS